MSRARAVVPRVEAPTPPGRCPLTAALDAVGGKWSLVCLYFLGLGPRRFNELQALVPDVSHKVLTETLRALARHGLVVRERRALEVRYRISEHGESVRPVLEAVRAWGHAHLAWRDAVGVAGGAGQRG